MYKVGIVSNRLSITSETEEIFRKNDCLVMPLDEADLKNQLDRIDGIILEEESQERVAQVCSHVLTIKKGQSNPFVWILSSSDSGVNHQVYLQLGVDGTFNQKNFPGEISLVVKNAFVRYEKEPIEATKNLPLFEGTSIYLNSPEQTMVIRNQQEVKVIGLTRIEYQAVDLMDSRPGQVLTYKEIYEYIWEKNYSNEKYRVANVIFRIREKLELAGINSRCIKTIRAKGYSLMKENLLL